MKLSFTKMHGLGNDFMVINGVNQKVSLSPEMISGLADRHTGIGFDQLLLVEPATQKDSDFSYRIFNADGQEVGQCGNGARCLALFVKQQGLINKNHMRVATQTTVMDLQINPDNTVSVNMGQPQLAPSAIPLLAPAQAREYLLPLEGGKSIAVHAISLGNPHAVLVVPDVSSALVPTLGKQISLHPHFPEQTNTGFMEIVSSNHIKLRVFERGCGETLACGSGAVAAAAIGRLYYDLDENIKVSLTGGDLFVSWPDTQGPITLTGAATFVYEGEWQN